MEATIYASGTTTGGIKIGSLDDLRAAAILAFAFSQHRVLQEGKDLRKATQPVFDRITRQNRFSFPAQKLHASRGDALFYFFTHADLVPNLGTIKFSNGERTVWVLDCGIEDINLVEFGGLTTIFSYSILGGSMSITPPA